MLSENTAHLTGDITHLPIEVQQIHRRERARSLSGMFCLVDKLPSNDTCRHSLAVLFARRNFLSVSPPLFSFSCLLFKNFALRGGAIFGSWLWSGIFRLWKVCCNFDTLQIRGWHSVCISSYGNKLYKCKVFFFSQYNLQGWPLAITWNEKLEYLRSEGRLGTSVTECLQQA